MSEKRYYLTRDLLPVYGPDTYDGCWLRMHKTSSGASVDWLLKHEGYAIVEAPEFPMIVVVYYPDLKRGYRLTLPLAELGHALAVCGWDLRNKLPRTPEVLAELELLEAAGEVHFPGNVASWFARYAAPLPKTFN